MLQRRERLPHPAPNDLHLDNPSHTAAAGVVCVHARSVFMSLFVFPRWANKTRQLAGLFLSTAPLYLTGVLFLLGGLCWLWVDPTKPVCE